MLSEKEKLTYEKLLEYKHSTRMELADRVLPDLLKSANPQSEAAQVLTKWDRQTNADSRGAVLFQMFVSQYLSAGPGGLAAKMRVKYDWKNPVETATGLSDPAAAAAALERVAADCRRLHGSLDIPWGEVYRFASGNADVPGNGGPGSSGIFRTMRFSERKGNRFYAVHGETFVCAIEFAPRDRQRARCALGYGNFSQAGSPHLEDQLPLIAAKQLHPVIRDRKELDRNAELRERLPE
jgi:acyl-homoserine-lactone acylase